MKDYRLVDESVLDDFDKKLEKHSAKKDRDNLNIRTLRYGITQRGYNEVLRRLNVKKERLEKVSSQLKSLAKKYSMAKANKGQVVQRGLEDLVRPDKEHDPNLTREVAYWHLYDLAEYLEEESGYLYKLLENEEKKAILTIGFQNPSRIRNNKELISAIGNLDKKNIAYELLNYDYKRESDIDGQKKRSLLAVAGMFGHENTKELDDYFLNNIKKDPTFYDRTKECFATIKEYSRCVKEVNTLHPVLNKDLPKKEETKEQSEVNIVQKIAKTLMNFTFGDKKMQTNEKEVTNGTGNENDNLQ